MDGRAILEPPKKFGKYDSFFQGQFGRDPDKIRIFIDSKSLGKQFKKNSIINRLLSYSRMDNFEFVRQNYNTTYYEIDRLPHFHNKIDEHGRGSIDIYKDKEWIEGRAITPVVKYVEETARQLLKKFHHSFHNAKKI